MTKKKCAVILGDYINGYAIVKELYDNNVSNIIVITYNKKLAYYSRFVKQSIFINQEKEDLLDALKNIKELYSEVVLFPTDDWYIEQLTEIFIDIENFCFIPFNPFNSKICSNKIVQYQFCENNNIPYPKTIGLSTPSDYSFIQELRFPLIIKPVVRNDLSINVFRSKLFEDNIQLEENKSEIMELLSKGIEFLISEVIPGSSHGNIYAYCCYVSKEGEILNEWIGRKLSQYPDDYGVFSSASNEAPEIILEQGRKLVKAMNITGFCEPEFKYDERDGKYKLMEVNLRSMMWNEVGRISGVNLHLTQWQYANQEKVIRTKQNRDRKVILFYFKHELLNLLFQKNYRKVFFSIWKQPNIYWAGCYRGDFKPIFKNIILTFKNIYRKIIG